VGQTSVEILVQHLNRPVPALAPRCPDAPFGLVELVERMLTKNFEERPSALEVRAVLTPAERDVAVLAAAGRSNREIASDLGLSVRTVENRVQRVYEKLAISGRADLAAALRRS
jgi:DNA-binding NarL/FixJ family response regulator